MMNVSMERIKISAVCQLQFGQSVKDILKVFVAKTCDLQYFKTTGAPVQAYIKG